MSFIKVAFTMGCLLSSSVSVADVEQALPELQKQWAKAQYGLEDKAQKAAFLALIDQADVRVAEYPASAELWIWKGIISSSYAGVKGGLGALSLVDDAKDAFEKAMSIDDTALMGSAYTSLGTLYFKVPGWPLSFGDDDKALELLNKALVLNPAGIDSNYFYAQYLIEQDDYAQAEQYLIKAQAAPTRSTRPLADQGRQQEITLSLASVREKLTP
jgi:tetratricopeptide (TPR) repeat protein